jgi:putative tryptophan/tyrosine transport system substrate-binding protein
MRRREFLTIVGAAVGWVLPAQAQQPTSNMPVVTLINARGTDGATILTAEFRKGLSQTGLAEGKDVAVEYHWLDGHYEKIPASSTMLSSVMSR